MDRICLIYLIDIDTIHTIGANQNQVNRQILYILVLPVIKYDCKRDDQQNNGHYPVVLIPWNTL